MKIVDGKNVYSVSEVNALARRTLEQISFWVEGEISSFGGHDTRYRYIYFDLKDPKTGFKLPCIIEPETFLSQNYLLENGKIVLALGTLTLWEREARLQLHVLRIEDFGAGFLLAELEKLKAKLENLRYFDESKKREIPPYPLNIAVITSHKSDAWHDFKKHTIERFPIMKLTLFDVNVQGEKSASQIVKAVKNADKMSFDTVAIIRGGGSLEDFAAYNSENVANAIFNAKTPIVVGVGHEKDITIASLVADISASTPTDAAKIVTENFVKLEQKLEEFKLRAHKAFKNRLFNYQQSLDMSLSKLVTNREKYIYFTKRLDSLSQILTLNVNKIIYRNQTKIQVYKSSITANWKNLYAQNYLALNSYKHKLLLSTPENILKRGYSITKNLKGNVIKDVEAVAASEKLKVKLAKGSLLTKIITKEN